MGVEPKIGGTPPKSFILIGFSIYYKPSILGYPYFWKHPNRPLENILLQVPAFFPLRAGELLLVSYISAGPGSGFLNHAQCDLECTPHPVTVAYSGK